MSNEQKPAGPYIGWLCTESVDMGDDRPEFIRDPVLLKEVPDYFRGQVVQIVYWEVEPS